jgi:hypothetical protein
MGYKGVAGSVSLAKLALEASCPSSRIRGLFALYLWGKGGNPRCSATLILAYLRQAARQQPKEAFAAWWKETAPN